MIFNHQSLISEKVGQHSSSMFIGLLHPPWFHGILKSFWSEPNRTPSDSQTSFVLVFETCIAIVAGFYAILWGSRTMVCNFNYAPKWFIYIRLVPFQSGPTCPADGQKEKAEKSITLASPMPLSPNHKFLAAGEGWCCRMQLGHTFVFCHFLCLNQPNIRVPLPKWDWLGLFRKIWFQNLRHKLKRQSARMKNVGVFENRVFKFIPKKKLATHRIGNAPCSFFWYPFLLVNPSCSVDWPQATPGLLGESPTVIGWDLYGIPNRPLYFYQKDTLPFPKSQILQVNYCKVQRS